MKNKNIAALIAAIVAAASAVQAQIPLPDPPQIVPRWRNVAPFSGQFPDTNGWSFYGTQYPGLGYTNATHSYTNWPGVADVGMCMSFTAGTSASPPGNWAGGSILVTNQFDDGDPVPNMITVYPFGGYDWNLLVTTTNDVPLYEAELGDAQMVSQNLGGGLYWNYATNWSRLSVVVPALTNPVVKIIIRSPWQGQTFWGGWPFGYYAPNNGGILGGVMWDPLFPPVPPGPLTPPPSGVLAISTWTNGTVVYWSLTNSPATLKYALEPAGPYSSFGYTALTNIHGTNVVSVLVSPTNASSFYRLEN